MKDYIVIHKTSADKIQAAVQLKIAEGYSAHGSLVAFSGKNGMELCEPMTK